MCLKYIADILSEVLTWCHYDEPEIEEIKYGLLYNWYAVDDVRNICSDGWHVSTSDEVNTLSVYLGGNSVSGGKLKEVGFIYWNTPNTGATNEVGFNARGAGYRNKIDGLFGSLLDLCGFWGEDLIDFFPSYFILLAGTGQLYPGTDDPIRGRSVRLIKDSTILSHGETGTYTGNDGKVYRTICIGTQEWLADNLCETKYRNGDDIPEVTDNAAWAALTSGALCAYDNDWDNM